MAFWQEIPKLFQNFFCSLKKYIFLYWAVIKVVIAPLRHLIPDDMTPLISQPPVYLKCISMFYANNRIMVTGKLQVDDDQTPSWSFCKMFFLTHVIHVFLMDMGENFFFTERSAWSFIIIHLEFSGTHYPVVGIKHLYTFQILANSFMNPKTHENRCSNKDAMLRVLKRLHSSIGGWEWVVLTTWCHWARRRRIWWHGRVPLGVMEGRDGDLGDTTGDVDHTGDSESCGGKTDWWPQHSALDDVWKYLLLNKAQLYTGSNVSIQTQNTTHTHMKLYVAAQIVVKALI